MTDVFVGLGSNLGDRAAHLRFALEQLEAAPGLRLRAVSTMRLTRPEGGPPQPDYLNAVARLESTLGPQRTLRRLMQVEQRRGRRRGVPRGPRTLDLDLLLFGAARLSTRQLVLPHPRLGERRFVVEPLAEIAPELRLPSGSSARACLQALSA